MLMVDNNNNNNNNENSIHGSDTNVSTNKTDEQNDIEVKSVVSVNSLNDESIKKLVMENKRLQESLNEQEEALFEEIQRNAKLEKTQSELREQLKFSKMEITDLYQKITFITNKITCDDMVKDLIYRQQAEIISLKEELSLSKNTSNQLKNRLKSQVEDLKFIKRQSMQITSEMAKEVELQLTDIQNQLNEANQKIVNQQKLIESSNQLKVQYKKTTDELLQLKAKLNKEDENKETRYKNIKECFDIALEKINNLEKINEDIHENFNEADKNKKIAQEKYELEKQNSYQMANEMGQQIIDLTDNIENYKKIIESLKKNKTEDKNVITEKMIKMYQKQISETKKALCIINKDLMNYKCIFKNNVNSHNFIEKINEKIEKMIELINGTNDQIHNQLKESFAMQFDMIENEKDVDISDELENIDNEIKYLIENEMKLGDLEYETVEDINTLATKYKDELSTINEIGDELIRNKEENKLYKEKLNFLSELILKLMKAIIDLETENKQLNETNEEYLTVINETGEDVRKLHFIEKDLVNAISESGHEICVLKFKIKEILDYQEKYMSMEDELLLKKVSNLTSRNQELEKELAVLRKFDVNSSLKKSLEEGQLQSAWYEITKLRSVVDKLTQSSKKLEKELSNARNEIKTIISTRDEAILTKDEAEHNLEVLQNTYLNQVKLLKEEIARVNNNTNTYMNDLTNNNNNNNFNSNGNNTNQYNTNHNLNNNNNNNNNNYNNNNNNNNNMYKEINHRNNRNDYGYDSQPAIENRLHEAEEMIDKLTRENFEYSKRLNKVNKINEKLLAKVMQNEYVDRSNEFSKAAELARMKKKRRSLSLDAVKASSTNNNNNDTINNINNPNRMSMINIMPSSHTQNNRTTDSNSGITHSRPNPSFSSLMEKQNRLINNNNSNNNNTLAMSSPSYSSSSSSLPQPPQAVNENSFNNVVSYVRPSIHPNPTTIPTTTTTSTLTNYPNDNSYITNHRPNQSIVNTKANNNIISSEPKEKVNNNNYPSRTLKVKSSLENLVKNKQVKRLPSQLNLQSSIQRNESITSNSQPPSYQPPQLQQPQPQHTNLLQNNMKTMMVAKKPNRNSLVPTLSSPFLCKNNLPKSFMSRESPEEYNKLIKRYGSPPVYNRIVDLKDEQNEINNYMEFEIQNQNQILEAIRNGEIPFYSYDDEDEEIEEVVINE